MSPSNVPPRRETSSQLVYSTVPERGRRMPETCDAIRGISTKDPLYHIHKPLGLTQRIRAKDSPGGLAPRLAPKTQKTDPRRISERRIQRWDSLHCTALGLQRAHDNESNNGISHVLTSLTSPCCSLDHPPVTAFERIDHVDSV
jgi:hypothetical protein